jgi:arylsulfatase A-like enzyme
LDALGLADNTYVVFMSDNGAPGGRRRPKENMPLRGGKSQFYEGGIRVPLIVRGPGIAPKSHSRESVIGYDLLPTFCSWAGVTTPEGVEGANLAPLLDGQPGQFKRPEPALLFHFPHHGQGPQIPMSAIILDNHKLIKAHETGTLQLFNLADDLSETNELSKQLPELLKKMEKELARRLEQTEAQMLTPNPDYDPEASPAPTRRPGGKGDRGRRRSPSEQGPRPTNNATTGRKRPASSRPEERERYPR